MCQECVGRGEYTQEEYDNRILNGDTSVMPIIDLPMEDVIDFLSKCVVSGELSPAEAALHIMTITAYRSGEKS